MKKVPERRDFDGMEARRRQAGRLFAAGKLTQAEIGRKLEVSRVSVHRWHKAWLASGLPGLKRTGQPGRKPRLGREQLKWVESALRLGPEASGFPTGLWTLARVAAVIENATGVRYHAGHVWRILGQLGWTLQRPARRALERNDRAIARWVREDWPRVKKTLRAAKPGSSLSTKAASRNAHRSTEPGRHEAKRRS